MEISNEKVFEALINNSTSINNLTSEVKDAENLFAGLTSSMAKSIGKSHGKIAIISIIAVGALAIGGLAMRGYKKLNRKVDTLNAKIDEIDDDVWHIKTDDKSNE